VEQRAVRPAISESYYDKFKAEAKALKPDQRAELRRTFTQKSDQALSAGRLNEAQHYLRLVRILDAPNWTVQTMTQTSPLIALVLLALMLVASTFANAEDNAVKQLDAAGSYDAALGASSAQPPPTTTPEHALAANADQLTNSFKMLQETNKVYEIVILASLALISLFIVLYFLTAKTAYSGAHIVNASGLICIIWGTILLVLMAQSDQQMTAAVGILGAVAGYLFRSMHQGEDSGEQRQKNKVNP
jgi:hypothetical protein